MEKRTMRLLFRLCFCAAALWLLYNRPAAAQALNTPPAVQASVQQALALVGVRYRSHSRQETDQAGQDFERLMDRIGTQISPRLARQAAATEGESITAKILLIAWDRQQRPQVYQEIDREYIHKVGDPRERAPHSPLVSQQHRTEAYRLPWEFFLMHPPSSTLAPRALNNGYIAVAQLGNEASLLTLGYIFQQTTQPDVEVMSEFIKREQDSVIGAIMEFHNPQGVEALLTCIGLSDVQQAELARHKATATPEQLWGGTNEFGWETHKELAQALAQQQQEKGWWQRTLAAYPAAGLTTGQKDLIEKVKNAKVGQHTP